MDAPRASGRWESLGRGIERVDAHAFLLDQDRLAGDGNRRLPGSRAVGVHEQGDGAEASPVGPAGDPVRQSRDDPGAGRRGVHHDRHARARDGNGNRRLVYAVGAGTVHRHQGAHHGVAGVREDDDAGGVYRDGRRSLELGGGGRSVVARVALRAGPGYGGDRAIRGHLADAVVPAIGDIEAARGIQGDAARRVEAGVDGGSAVARVTSAPVAGHRADDAVGRHLADAVVPAIGDVDVAGGV